MTVAIDTSVILASLDPGEPMHAACDRIVSSGEASIYLHALAETFSALTGGRGRPRLQADVAAALIESDVLPYVKPHGLNAKELATALHECRDRGVRGGAIYDFLHLVAARKAGAHKLVTLDARDFRAFHRKGDPPIETP